MTGKILADVVESFLAALLLDKGLAFAKRFLEVSLFPKLAVSMCFSFFYEYEQGGRGGLGTRLVQLI